MGRLTVRKLNFIFLVLMKLFGEKRLILLNCFFMLVVVFIYYNYIVREVSVDFFISKKKIEVYRRELVYLRL